jgi:site-specific DNA-cytosine methylase
VDTTITTLEFCAGYGGIGLGLKNIFGERMRTIAYCELEGFAQANLLSKMEKGLMDVAPIWNDLKTFPYESFHGLVDILIAGYPCQPFSSAGKRAGKEDPRHLWPWIADGIRLLQPRMCFFENVEGHISLGLSTVISDLEELGYKVSWGIFSASEVGAVHQRKRVFIMAHNKSQSSGRLCERTQTQESKFGFNCEAELADSNGGGVSGSRNELGNSCKAGQGRENTSQNGIIGNVWPSRPGQPQYAWEPPRVVVGRMAHSNSPEPSQERGDNGEVPQFSPEQRTDNGASISGGESQHRGDEPPRDMGNTEQLLFPATGEHGAMDEASGIPADRERSESPQADTESSSAREREGSWSNASECSEIEPKMGRDIDGTTDGMDIAELSGLSNSELAEIREWMVKGDNRTDELRSCGNGVVPATAERAFRVLMEELINK